MESRGDLALYEYLYRCIRHDIAHGKVEPGQKLPSKRALAKQLGVSLITIEAAYDQLVAEGYIRSRERCGYYACDLAPAAKIEEQRNAQHRTATETSANRRREDHVSNPNGPQPISQNEDLLERRTGYRPSDADFAPPLNGLAPHAQNAPSDAPPLADFTHNTLATTMLPYSAWAKAVRRTLSDESAASLAEAASAAGSPELRSAIADHLRQYRGMDVSPGQVVIGAGSQTLYQLLVQLLGRTRRYAVEDPGYPLLARMYEQQDAQVAHIGLDDSGIDIDALEASGASVAHIMPSHQFPTGIVTTAARRRELLNWAREGDRYLIEDDYDSEFRFSGLPIPTLQSLDTRGRVIYLNTFSKTIAPALRISYMILPQALLARWRSTMGFYSCAVPSFEQLTLTRFLDGGYFERHVSRMKKHYKARLQGLLALLAQPETARLCTARQAVAGLHFLLEFHTKERGQSLRAALGDAGLSAPLLSEFYLRKSPAEAERCAVVQYSGLTEADFAESLQKLSQRLTPEA